MIQQGTFPSYGAERTFLESKASLDIKRNSFDIMGETGGLMDGSSSNT